MSKPAVTTISPDSIEDSKSSDDVVFIGYISSDDDTALQSFSAVAQKYRQEFTFGVISDQAIHQAENMHSPTVVSHIVGDGETRTLSGSSEPETLEKFVSEASRRVIEELSQHNQQRLLDVSDHTNLRLIVSDVASHSAVGPWFIYSERPKMTAENFVGRSMISQRATMIL